MIPRERWRFVAGPGNLPRLRLETGFAPGRYYRVTYRATGALVAGVGLAAMRDAAAAFRYRSDLPIHGQRAYAFGVSQAGRFLRQFLYEGFNADERDRRVFDAMWMHVAGAARGGFNERFATPIARGVVHGRRSFRLPTSSRSMSMAGVTACRRAIGRISGRRSSIRTRRSSTGVAAGPRRSRTRRLDGKRDLELPDNVRMYLLAGTQHIVAPFPPVGRHPSPERLSTLPREAAGSS